MRLMIDRIVRYYIKYKEDLMRFLLFFACISTTYLMFGYGYITHDSLLLPEEVAVAIPNDIVPYIKGGRFFSYFFHFILYFFYKLGINQFDESEWVFQLIGSAVYAFDTLLLHKILFSDNENDACDNKRKTPRLLQYAVVLIAFINPFVVETYTYNAFDWSIQALLALLAAYFLINKRYVLGIIFALCAYSMYQSDIFIVLIACIGGVLSRYFDNKKELIKYIFIYGCICLGIAAGMLGGQKMLANATGYSTEKNIASLGEIVESVTNIAEVNEADIYTPGTWYYKVMEVRNIYKYSFGMLPVWFLLFLVAVPILFLFIESIFIKRDIGNAIIYLIVGCLLGLIPFSMTVVLSESLFFPRTLLPIFFSSSVLWGALVRRSSNDGRLIEYINSVGIVIGMFILVFYTRTVILDCYITRAIDEREVRAIAAEIERYEELNGVEVVNIACHYDSEKTLFYDENKLNYRVNAIADRMVREEWSDIRYLMAITGRRFESTRHLSDEEFENIFGNVNWDYYCPEEQLVFDGDTLYWAVY